MQKIVATIFPNIENNAIIFAHTNPRNYITNSNNEVFMDKIRPLGLTSERAGKKLGLTSERAAKKLGISTDTLAAYRDRGLLSFHKVPGPGGRSSYWYPEDGLEAFLKATFVSAWSPAKNRMKP